MLDRKPAVLGDEKRVRRSRKCSRRGQRWRIRRPKKGAVDGCRVTLTVSEHSHHSKFRTGQDETRSERKGRQECKTHEESRRLVSITTISFDWVGQRVERIYLVLVLL